MSQRTVPADDRIEVKADSFFVSNAHCKNEQHERQQGHGRKKHFG